MNVGILSMQRVNNFGSLLQSYSLMKMIAAYGGNVCFINIKPNQSDSMLLPAVDTMQARESERKGVLGKIGKIDQYAINRLRIRKTADRQNEYFENFRRKYLEIDKQQSHFDLCIIGSDEVFNCLTPSKWGFTSQLFGNIPEADHVMTYAASCGATSYDRVPDAVRKRISEVLPKIEKLSVRDTNSREFLSHFTCQNISEHMDPVLVGNFDEEVNKSKLPHGFKEPYCIIYSYYNRFHTKEEISKIKTYCKAKGLKIIAVGAPQMWIKDYYELTPFEALLAFKHADFVITDTFHGTVFSYMYSRKYAVIVRESNKNKLLDLVRKLAISEHLVDINGIDDAYKITDDQGAKSKLIEKERRRTLEYLSSCLK